MVQDRLPDRGSFDVTRAEGIVDSDRTSDRTAMSGIATLTAQEAAAKIGVNERTIRRAIASGALAADKRGGVFAISENDLDRWQKVRGHPGNTATTGDPAPGNPSGSPAPNGNLPRPLTSFISRDREVAAAVAMLRRQDVRLLSLIGPGGVGKTRLAIRIAEELADTCDEGPWFVPLAGVTDPGRFVDSIVSALGVPKAYGQSARAALHAHLANRCGLIVLDNLEQVIDAAPEIAEILVACPGITALVTSRTLLRLTGEHAFPVPPLDVPTVGEAFALDATDCSPAMKLFEERATALMPSFTLTTETAPIVADICRLVDGLPLALELAAARITAMPLEILRDRLHQQLAVLTTGTRDGPRRHRTMRDAISWSYDLLTPRERDVLCMLSVFTGGFIEDAATCIACGGDAGSSDYAEPIIDTIGSLIDKSLVRHANRDNQRHRFEMLETIRAFGLERAAATGELAGIQDRHADWVIAYVRHLLDGWRPIPEITAENQWKLVAIDVEQDNVRAALGWLHNIGDRHRMLILAVAMQSFWELCGSHDEAISWLEQGLALTGNVPVSALRVVQMTIGRQRRRQGKYDHAGAHYECALALAREENDPLAIAQAIYALGCVATNLRDTELAEAQLIEALRGFTELGDNTGICGSHYFLGVVYLQSYQPEKSLAALEQALATRRLRGAFFNESVILNALGIACCANSLLDRAQAAKEQSLALWQRGEGVSQEVLAEWLGLAAVIAFRHGHHAHATWLLGAGEALSESLGVPRMLGTADQRARLHQSLIAQLGQERFDAEHAAGAQTPPEMAAAANVAFDAAHAAPEPNPVNPQTPDLVLTPREQEVLNLLAAGMRDRAIADQLFLSVRTVQGHVARITYKLGATSRTSAMAIAFSRGLISTHQELQT
jgi:non-specific serine/threonine protein kinase